MKYEFIRVPERGQRIAINAGGTLILSAEMMLCYLMSCSGFGDAIVRHMND